MESQSPSFGIIGIGTMGGNLALNIAEKGFGVAAFDLNFEKAHALKQKAGSFSDKIFPCQSLEDFVKTIQPPRNIILLIPAGQPVDQQIEVLRPLLDKEDLIIDAGNANFRETNRRAVMAEKNNEHFLGMGVSGGAEGARHGHAIRGGGSRVAWLRVAPMLEAISAKFDGTPCANWMGPHGSGHYIKMVHNGIEYADMQMIAEVYGIMRDGLKMSANEIADVFNRWNKGPLKSFLIEISGEIAGSTDISTGKPVLDIILDKAGQKGTGRWTAIEALHRGAPVTAIDAAVAARNLSARFEERKHGEEIFGPSPQKIEADHLPIAKLENALLAGKVACYAQGFSMLAAASSDYGWNFPLPDIARNWRAGCIIRSAMLNDMAKAMTDDSNLNLMFHPTFSKIMKETEADLRWVMGVAATHGHPAPALSAGLSYFNMMRTGRSTANMIQGQRDFFGAHSFERTDQEGSHHGPWDKFEI